MPREGFAHLQTSYGSHPRVAGRKKSQTNHLWWPTTVSTSGKGLVSGPAISEILPQLGPQMGPQVPPPHASWGL